MFLAHLKVASVRFFKVALLTRIEFKVTERACERDIKLTKGEILHFAFRDSFSFIQRKIYEGEKTFLPNFVFSMTIKHAKRIVELKHETVLRQILGQIKLGVVSVHFLETAYL